jgi:hypothetical protein
MDNRSWMYLDSPQGLYREDYSRGVEGFIDFSLSNPKNISEGKIKCLCVKCKNKKFLQSDVVMMHLLKEGFVKKYLCWFAYREPHAPYETIIKKTVGSTSSSSNLYEVVDDNSSPYKSMMIDAIRINHGYLGESSHIDEEPHVDTTRFFLIF